MTSPARAYEQILEAVDEGKERQVYDILVENLNRAVTRAQLVSQVSWEIETSYETRDRVVRRCIQHLRAKDFPIISTSKVSGYTLKADEGEIDRTIAELNARIESERDTIRHLHNSKEKARLGGR